MQCSRSNYENIEARPSTSPTSSTKYVPKKSIRRSSHPRAMSLFHRVSACRVPISGVITHMQTSGKSAVTLQSDGSIRFLLCQPRFTVPMKRTHYSLESQRLLSQLSSDPPAGAWHSRHSQNHTNLRGFDAADCRKRGRHSRRAFTTMPSNPSDEAQTPYLILRGVSGFESDTSDHAAGTPRHSRTEGPKKELLVGADDECVRSLPPQYTRQAERMRQCNVASYNTQLCGDAVSARF